LQDRATAALQGCNQVGQNRIDGQSGHARSFAIWWVKTPPYACSTSFVLLGEETEHTKEI
jgi:hypothetical protein